MKILILTNFDLGLYSFRRELIAELLKNNEVYISLPNGKFVAPFKQMGCVYVDTPIDRRGTNPVKDMKLYFAYSKMLRKIKPDLVITYTVKPNVYGGLACRLANVPYAANITGLGTAFECRGLLKSIVSLMYKIGLKKAKTVFFENSYNKKLFIESGTVKEEKAVLLNGAGVNLDYYSPVDYPECNSTTKFLFIGRIMREKGVDELLSSVKRLHEEGYDISLDILGEMEEDYTDEMKKYDNVDFINYHGFIEDVRPYIANCHCFVLQSYHEGMSNTNLECASMARPIITSRIPGCMEAVIDGESGLLCETKDEESLISAMRKFCNFDSETRIKMGKAGRKLMEGKFDKNKVVNMTLKGLGL